ncbi:DUF3810 domain-containing protein [Aequorivita antarctica]|uniref:DUF3810 domain-containing protein n=1 Tax=Aequorivita antarctica TaxID=153266 RepID=A0A5C6YXQ0_9FLAO|nr:DUF3810 domain-containing protein [Aequorivita antarctica]TXD71898.1 DUF3810 domain-containing protein [Aequorivita antarctica]SRX75479.1 hypothetical protein AEQU3_02474 [Aequorivita antarctica]
MQKRTSAFLTIFLIVQIIALQVLKRFPEFVEKYYSLGVYPWISKISRYIFGWVPFSVGDLFYLLIAIVAIRWLYKNVKRLRQNDQVGFFVDILAAVSVVYFMFHVLWGFNYYRLPLHKSLNLNNDYTTEQLLETTDRFIKKSNSMHRELGFADSVKIELPYTQKEMFKKTLNGYKNLEKEFPQLALSPRSIKKSGWSLGLTYMGYSGYLNPFSGEAQVNNLMKTYKFPAVACHEEAHQIGYAAENEANFIATLSTLHNDDPYMKYTGYIFTLRYLINEVARRDEAKYEELLTTINPGILKSYEEMRDFWDSYQNPFEVFSKMFWDSFLKANNQSRGIMSYDYMVALVVNYYEDKPL